MLRTAAVRILFAAAALLPSLASGGTFKAVPVKLFLDSRARTGVLKIVNDAEEKVTVQIAAKRWTQDGSGVDQYEDTDDVVFFPKIATIGPGEEKIIRVGCKGKSEAREKTYRLLVQELPVVKPGETGLKLALTLGVPIFVKPLKEVVAWSFEPAGLSEEKLAFRIGNGGNAHVLATRISAVGLDRSGGEVFSREIGGWYTLAGGSKLYAMAIPREECFKAKQIKMKAATGSGDKELAFAVTDDMCSPAQPPPLPRKPPEASEP